MGPDSRPMTENESGSVEDAVGQMLHRTAQPLTVIRGILELSLTQPMTADEQRSCLNQALARLSEVTAEFDELRELVNVRARGAGATSRV